MLLCGIAAMKNAVAYTRGDLLAVLNLCRENEFLRRVAVRAETEDPVSAWKTESYAFFSARRDAALCAGWISEYGKQDLESTLALLSLFETRVQESLQNARQNIAQKGKLYVMLGFFAGSVTALMLL